MQEKLWELTEDIKQLADYIGIIEDDENTPGRQKDKALEEYFGRWLEAGEKFDQKAEDTARYIRYLEALEQARREEYHRLRELADQAKRNSERLRQYLTKQMIEADRAKIEGTTCNISLRKKPAKVILEVEPDQLPKEYQKVEVKAKLNDIKKLLKTEEVPWASMSTIPDYSLMIK